MKLREIISVHFENQIKINFSLPASVHSIIHVPLALVHRSVVNKLKVTLNLKPLCPGLKFEPQHH
jgi:hypothetical protein